MCERDPEKPSVAANSRELRGDLDAIVAQGDAQGARAPVRDRWPSSPTTSGATWSGARSKPGGAPSRIARASSRAATASSWPPRPWRRSPSRAASWRPCARPAAPGPPKRSPAEALRRAAQARELLPLRVPRRDSRSARLDAGARARRPAGAPVSRRSLAAGGERSVAAARARGGVPPRRRRPGERLHAQPRRRSGRAPELREGDRPARASRRRGHGGRAEKATLARAYVTGSGIRLVAGDPAAAVAMAEKGIPLARELAERRPGDRQRELELAQAWQYYAFSLAGGRTRCGGLRGAQETVRDPPGEARRRTPSIAARGEAWIRTSTWSERISRPATRPRRRRLTTKRSRSRNPSERTSRRASSSRGTSPTSTPREAGSSKSRRTIERPSRSSGARCLSSSPWRPPTRRAWTDGSEWP